MSLILMTYADPADVKMTFSLVEPGSGHDFVAFARAGLGWVFDFADALDPTVAGHHHVGIFVDDKRIGIEFLFSKQHRQPWSGAACPTIPTWL